MEIEWDPVKALKNDRKHGVRFAEAVSVLEDEQAMTTSEISARGEERWVTLGADSTGRILVVVYTWRGDRLRLISARKATPSERAQYGEGL